MPTPQDLQPPGTNLGSRAWYSALISQFRETPHQTIIGHLTTGGHFAVEHTQVNAWVQQIEILKPALQDIDGWIFFEFNIPRLGRRIDAVVLLGSFIFVIEFKVGSSTFDRAAIEQVWDYALDLKNFHEGSHHAVIVPILVATDAAQAPLQSLIRDDDGVFHPLSVGCHQIRDLIEAAMADPVSAGIVPEVWAMSSYKPTPTIVEAARALYANHSVEAIARFDAGAQNLRFTSARVEELVEKARRERRKIICFVTGVPGAGKTLVGLNIATHRASKDDPTHAVYLSGNGPLIEVLSEALARDEYLRRKESGDKTARKGKIKESIKAFIQNVHHFRDDALVDQAPPAEHVAIFDEAQRAWNLQQTANFMSRKKNRQNFQFAESEFLISYLDRHPDWAVVVCLVGGGQEINTGEAGIEAWLEAINSRFSHWDMYISDRLTDAEYAAGHALQTISNRPQTYFDECLHLAVSMRSFRAEHVSSFVKALLDHDEADARHTLHVITDKFPIVVTRCLDRAKQWIRRQARGSERYGLVASSKAIRLKPHAVDIRVKVDPVNYFLNDRDDIRSSYYLEDAATEFQVQGLELDWVCVTWDADLRVSSEGVWSYNDFVGSRWQKVRKPELQQYLKNAYRVLLTRARQGMVIFVPPGDVNDPTRHPDYYHGIYGYLRNVGVKEL